jgi:hypothetical protein
VRQRSRSTAASRVNRAQHRSLLPQVPRVVGTAVGKVCEWLFDIERLKILLKNVPHTDGEHVEPDDVEALATWDPLAEPSR